MAARAVVTRQVSLVVISSPVLRLNCCSQVKPLISGDNLDARVRVLSLYKAWYRHIPFMVKDFELPRNEAECKATVYIIQSHIS